MRPTTVTATLVSALLVLTAACGDDDESVGTTAAPAATAPDTNASPTTDAATTAAVVTTSAPAEQRELCAIAAEIDESAEPPTMEQMKRYRDAAPPELQTPTQVVIDAVAAADGDFTAIIADPDAAAAIEQIGTIEAELCGSGDDGPPQDPSVTVIDEDAARVDVTATEYAFELDAPTEAGRYSFVMTNDGEEPHIMILVRLEEGVALGDVLAAEGDEGVAETFESSPAMSGEEGVLTANLGPGNWVLLCPVPGPEGHPHFVDGMIEEFTIA
ncbi:MAG: hypothetical protein ACK5OX_10470 [Desertimonas sp.]